MLHGGGQNRFSWKKTGQILADAGPACGRAGQPRARRQRPLTGCELHGRGAVRGHAGGARPDRAAGGADRRQHGRDDRHPRRRRGRPGEGDQAGAGRRGAAVREGRQRPHPRLHVQPRARLRVARGGRRRGRRVPAAPDQAAQPGGAEEEPAAPQWPVVLALGSGVSDQAGRGSVRAGGAARAGSDRPDHPDPADPRQALRRGQRGRGEGLPRQGAAAPSSSSCPRRDTPRPATTTTRSPKSSCSSSAGERSGFNFLEAPELPAPG